MRGALVVCRAHERPARSSTGAGGIADRRQSWHQRGTDRNIGPLCLRYNTCTGVFSGVNLHGPSMREPELLKG